MAADRGELHQDCGAQTGLAIIEAGCQAWNKLIDQPQTIMSIGIRDWAHRGQ